MNRNAWTSIALLLVILLIAFIRQIDFSFGTMVHFPATSVNLGGESDPVLDTLRSKESVDNNELRSLLVDSQNWRPEHRLFIARHEVTNLEYRLFLNAAQMQPGATRRFAHATLPDNHNFKPRSFNDIKYSNNRQPVVSVSWQDANTFCRFNNMRLPTAEEFEAASRFEMDHRTPTEFDRPIIAGSEEDIVVPIEVGKYQAKEGVLWEVIGNVMEWVAPEQGQHFLMGYSYKQYQPEQAYHPFKRHFAGPQQTANDFGFRCIYQAPTDFKPQLLRTQTISQDGMRCWRTRDNIGSGRFDLLNEHNQAHYGGGMLFPDELCELPQKEYQLGPQGALSTVALIRENPWGYSNYLLGKSAEQTDLDEYWIDAKEVSINQYRQFLNRAKVNDKVHSHPEEPHELDHTPLDWSKQLTSKELYEPVTGVSWWGAFAYCSWHNKRLPFAKEWENAVKGKQNRLYAWGNDHNQTKQDITPEGLHNMTRTVSEWTSTFIVGSNSAIVKGGSELFDWRIFGRAYVELKVSRSTQSPAIGFRCAK